MVEKIRRNVSLGSNIRCLRMKHKMTQRQVVAKLQLRGSKTSRETYAKIESGLNNINVTDLVILHEIWKEDYNSFFEGMKAPEVKKNKKEVSEK